MPTRPLSERIASMPLILAGPILRKVSQDTVTVWVALRKQRTVKLTVYHNGTEFMSGTRDTVTLGPHLHVVAVTAQKSGAELTPGATYEYNLTFTGASDGCATGDLFTPGVMAASEAQARAYLSYKMAGVRPNAPDRPSFVYAPEDLNLLRICHGSCRKPHGESVDGLVALDVMIRQALMPGADDPRPHMAFLSGDQIYADDVSDAFLKLLQETGDFLLGAPEALPGVAKPGDDYRPGYRAWTCDNIKFTAHKTDSRAAAKSHLMMLGEFYSIYLFAWSDVLWPVAEPNPSIYKDFADFSEICQHTDADMKATSGPDQFWIAPKKWKSIYSAETGRMRTLRKTLPDIRRALANVPVYMVFDDHEVTDDWYINKGWCADVLDAGNRNGRRFVQNGLTAITIFQSWGNTPEQFAQGTVGEKVLSALTNYHGGAGQNAQATELQWRLGMLTYAQGEVVADQTPPLSDRLLFHYHIKRNKYEIIALDTRTMRGYPAGNRFDPPEMLSTDALQLQIPTDTPMPANGVTMVIAPTNLVSEWLTETVVEEFTGEKNPYDYDAGDAWTGQTAGFERFLARLAHRAPDTGTTTRTARIVVLSGDIHYGFAQRLQYWAVRPFEAPVGSKPVVAVFAELVASSFKNQAAKTAALHEAKVKTAHSIRWLGWQKRPTPDELRVCWHPDRVAEAPELRRYRQTPSLVRDNEFSSESRVNLKPDWRYRIDMIGDPSPALANSSGFVAAYTDGPAAFWLKQFTVVGAASLFAPLLNLQLGRYVVGYNNMGEIRFAWGADDSINKWVIQRMWWMRPGDVEPHPYNTFPVSLKMIDERYPQPRYYGESETE